MYKHKYQDIWCGIMGYYFFSQESEWDQNIKEREREIARKKEIDSERAIERDTERDVESNKGKRDGEIEK